MKYDIGDNIAISSGGLEFNDNDSQTENPQMDVYVDHMSRLAGNSEIDYLPDKEILDEDGNITVLRQQLE